mmetsp:Transcript_10332/g.31729  ORF Transcript_10332/g.31729 Transcript_10332/m.31729 type:complete len:253 (+) Transcript_10332:1966-2724(+)
MQPRSRARQRSRDGAMSLGCIASAASCPTPYHPRGRRGGQSARGSPANRCLRVGSRVGRPPPASAIRSAPAFPYPIAVPPPRALLHARGACWEASRAGPSYRPRVGAAASHSQRPLPPRFAPLRSATRGPESGGVAWASRTAARRDPSRRSLGAPLPWLRAAPQRRPMNRAQATPSDGASVASAPPAVGKRRKRRRSSRPERAASRPLDRPPQAPRVAGAAAEKARAEEGGRPRQLRLGADAAAALCMTRGR